MSDKKASIGVVGGTGYTGVELLRLLAIHPNAEVVAVTSRSEKGKKVSDLFANLRGHVDVEFSDPDDGALKNCDLVFFATPNGVAMQSVPELLAAGVRVIDLAADFRIKDEKVWSTWYGQQHACPELLDRAVYGLPELNRELIASSPLVANPGCYPTAVQIGLLPLLEAGVVDARRIIADAKSGVSGAGRQAKVDSLFAEAAESFKAYGASGHRHLPEIKQGLTQAAGEAVGLTFVPHLVPMVRGIEATLYADLVSHDQDLQSLFEKRYQNEPFVDVLPAGEHPATRSVKGSNMCRLALHRQPDSNVVIVTSVIDNLVKGAAGQAIQNMNIMLGYAETAGLNFPAVLP
ncbi:N-acetyl-gamma-glutamyl-phosphate reductase [Oleiphilus messinensis]|uniref:N-acetyl-gamma-glutamyl-phosphate reductase n=1 Tax=Oleiphilus messinensis TaxID=141451 RepID=A0A1Y0IFZ2_9GAMM|nr:N-acetyl-gamma-glutamyl-phosphate reductase [Oleiphilus messinensis]ARU58726.1 N-acetyl-gamma-glutamyl-phosphate reductase [Oleiphilus messinensis]